MVLRRLKLSFPDPRAVNISEDFAFVYGGVTEMVGITLVGIRWRRWSRLLHDITKDTEFGKDPNFGQLVKQLNRFSAGCTIYCTVMSVIYAMSGASDSARCKRMNEEEGLREICGTLSSVWLPFEVSEAASKIIYALQLVLFLYAITPAVATAVLVLETAELIVSHINNLNNHFIEAFDSPDKEEITKRFGFCVRYHKYVLEYVYIAC